MDLENILEFLVLADTVNFGDAAKKLGITQSTLSKHIKQLEEDLGTPLFNRAKRSVTLNDFGTLFLEYAQRLARVHNQYTNAIQRQNSQSSRTLRIGVFPTMMYYNIMELLDLFQTTHPEISIEIVENETDRLKELLTQHQLDFAFLREVDQAESTDFCRETFATDTLVAMLPSSHPLAKESTISIEQLAGESFLLLPKNSILYSLCLKLFEDANITPDIAYTGGGENIFNLVPSGKGVSLLTKRPAAFLANPNSSVVDIFPTVRTYINLLYLPSSQLPSTPEIFLDFYHSLP